ncbi:helix-turn-helix domain-containing protein [Sporolactobacillus kofuensis]|uniref:Helix-turn-helix domain-containing protein n=1 Tax=Sporolactobacillus kofuensis TaxID=269672 RepID=A0ABW1WAG8_9BACL|nr:helix-turn-helix transcriptional regulator [Sporolactobacillus kofuensis]MCO7177053.1 helix-turn-helix transcriptional regulator [Sporolactobacillus kofuensis]
MSVLSDRLKESRERKNLKQTQVKERTNINNKTLSGYENGVSIPDPDTLMKLADLYDVSVDYLYGRTDKRHYYDLTKKDEKDIAKDMENLVNELNSDSALAFDGEPMDEETKRLVAQAIESNLRMAKQIAKKKFTPKKYRNEE